MNEWTPRVTGYHCNEEYKVNQFELGDFKSLKSVEDGKWLGSGVYFWDNHSNALYWKKQKERKQKEKNFKITTALLSLENLLDLTDLNDIDFCMKIIDYLKSIGVTEFIEGEIGKNINVLFNDTSFFKEYDVLKSNGLYKKELRTDFFNVNEKIPYLTTRVKTIYCVKNEKAIQQIQKVGE
ncbi:hypothetical protein [Staphylococcus arlettae]|uniref:hypothetical protein n=1 Tax=Staphylococcus arlettae TaxID=29378 RepID=UPI003EDFCD2F